MKKYIIIAVVLAVLGGAYWFLLPFVSDSKVSEEFPEQFSQEQMVTAARRGSFEGVGTTYAYGDVLVVASDTEYLVRLERNFEVDNAPMLVIGFGKNGQYHKTTEIGSLKGNKGSQNYVIPREIDLSEYNEIWIWSGILSRGYAKADLTNALK